ncbi:MAG: tandem-95 repeat protein [Anaerolineales bacterium]|nr:tandem-95 repeat protein [Anaerolineales bacterium]
MLTYRKFLAGFFLVGLAFLMSSLASANSRPLDSPPFFDQLPPLQTEPISPTETILDVFITDEGIFPPVLAVPPGATIQWTNQTSQTQRLASSALSSPTIVYLPLIFKGSDTQSGSSAGEPPAVSNKIAGSETNWQSGEILPGDSFSRVFDWAGEYPYLLADSPSLSGTIVVETPEVALLSSSTLIVTTMADELNNNDKCSLREAIIAANTNKAVGACPAGSSYYDDTIILDSGIYNLTIPGKNEDAAATGDLDINSKIKIVGASNGQTLIDASGLSDRVFHILSYGKAVISKVTIERGSGSYGGGIYNVGTLTLNYSSVLSGTASGNFGGGLKNDGTATLNNSTVGGNSAEYGGGIYNRGSLILNNSTISGNIAKKYGGGIKNQGTLKLNNATISTNTTEDKGGGVLNYNYGKTYFKNTIIAGNSAPNSSQADCGYISTGSQSFYSQGYNLVGDNTGCPSNGTGDQTTADPRIGPLQNNGGTTFTHALLPDSPAIDGGNPNGCKDSSGSLLTTDQRGELRPVDGNNDTTVRCDIGAYEAQLTDPAQTGPVFTVNTAEDPGDGICTVAHCSLREGINAANARLNDAATPDEVHFDILPGGPQTIQLTSTLVITDPLIIDGTTQPGAACNPLNLLIKLDGINAGPNADGLNITGGGTTVRGLIITRFGQNGLRLDTNGGNVLECNAIGTDASGASGLGNTVAGVFISNASNNMIGGTAAISGNLISGNGGAGIVISGTTATTNTIRFNTVFSNTGLGIDLGGDGVTPNDAGDPDTGPNSLQNFPVLTGAFLDPDDPDGGPTQIEGRLNSSTPNTQFTLEFFKNSTCDPSNFGEGETFLGSTVVTTDENGDALFVGANAFPVVPALPEDMFVTATATGPDGTSEFSQCVPVSPGNDSWPTALSLSSDGNAFQESYDQFLDKEGQSRWFKFKVQPNSQVIVTLTNLPENYDLTIYKDIQAAFDQLILPDDEQDLIKLNAEFATDAFAGDAVARGSRAPDAFARGSRAPDAFAVGAFSPDAIARGSRAPDAIARGSRAPDSFAPDAYAPDAYAPDALARGSRAPDAIARGSRAQDAFSSAQILSLIGISAFEGTASEGVIVNTWNNTGDFYVRVKGRNGAFSLAQKFHLEVELKPGSCGDVAPIGLPPFAAGGPDFKTIILTDLDRMEGSADDKAALLARLDSFIARPEVAGVVVDVGDWVADLNVQADNNPECPYAKNLVALAIKDIVKAYRNANPNLAYVVIVGNDDAIPFFRYPDRALLGPESDFYPPVNPFTASEASLRLDYVLGQDEYGSQVDLSMQVSTLPIPDLAVGRLVETAFDATHMLDAYLATANGVVTTPTSSLVTGYDFFADAAVEIQSQLESGLGVPADTLISARDVSPLDEDDPNDPNDPFAWTADQLAAQLLGQRHDVVFLGGHFSASSALAADYQSRLLSTDLTSSPVNLENALIFSIGCHSGYNIVNEHGISQITAEPDWAQAFARKGATFIGGTGYQYGDTDFLEYSERIYLEFSRQLRTGSGPVSVGQALVKAKQIYLAQTPQLRALHEKSLLGATLFGLPMLSINMPGARLDPPSDATIVSSVGDAPAATLGLKFADISFGSDDLDMDTSTVELQDIDDPGTTVEALYLSINGNVLTHPGEPVLPLLVRNVAGPGTVVLRGVGFRGGNYDDLPNVRVLTGAPTTEIRSVHTPFFSDVFYPIQPWSVNYFEALANGGTTTRLAVTPAQFKSTIPGFEANTLRRFSAMNFRLYYSDNTDTFSGFTPALAAPPVIAQVSAPLTEAGEVNFKIKVIGDPVAGVQEVWITYTVCSATDTCDGTWLSRDLTQNPADSTLWEGTFNLGANPENIRYIVQAVNGVGLVSMATNLGAYYIPGVDEDDLPATSLSLINPPDVASSGPYGSEATFSAILRDENNQLLKNRVVNFGLGAQSASAVTDDTGQATVTLPLLGLPGQYEVRAAFPGTAQEAASAAPNTFKFEITKQATVLCLEPPSASNDNACEAQPVSVSGFAGDDALLVATLTDAAGQRLFEKNVVFVVTGGGVFSHTRTVITDFAGRAPLGNLLLPPGDYTVKVYFNGTILLSTGQTVTLTDSRYHASVQTANLNLRNNPPVAVSDTYTIDEDAVLTEPAPGVLGNDTDTDSAVLTAVLVTGPGNGTLMLNPDGSFTYTPAPDFNGSDSFTYKANDGASDSNVATVTITVNPVNDAPILAPIGDKSINEDSLLTFTATASDNDIPLNTLTFSLVNAPSGATINSSTGIFTWTPSETQGPGSYTLTVIVNDNGNPALTDSETITITVNEVNQAPVLDPIGNKSANKGSLLTFTATASDSDIPANSLTFSLINAPSGATIDGSTGVFTWTPTKTGIYTTTVVVSDNGTPVLTDSETITITVINRPPVCTTATANPLTIWPPNKNLWVLEKVIGVTDPDGDPVTITITGIFQDEPVGKDKYSPDGYILGPNSAKVRAERDGKGDGRVYHIFFITNDGQGGSCSGEVRGAIVPHDQGGSIDAIDGGALYDSTKKDK